MIAIREDDLAAPAVRALIARHLDGMRDHSPPGAVHAFDPELLRTDGTTVWSAWIEGEIAGIAALRRLGDGTGEVKSMRTHDMWLRRGVAAALLDRMIAVARAEGLVRLSLETGRGPAFEPALALYRTRGFVAGEPYADYPDNGFSRFLYLTL